MEFDKHSHTYWHEGRRLPSVTEVLKASGRFKWYRGRAAADRGLRVHALTVAVDQGRDPLDAPPAIAGFIGAYLRFKHLLRAVPERREVPQARLDLWYAGTPDWEGRVQDMPTLLDLKTGAPAEWHRLQTAAYDLLDPSRNGRQRMAVYLGTDGRFHVELHPNRGDYAEWLQILREFHRGGPYGQANEDDEFWR